MFKNVNKGWEWSFQRSPSKIWVGTGESSQKVNNLKMFSKFTVTRNVMSIFFAENRKITRMTTSVSSEAL